MGQGTGLYNLARQLGGSFGIAITATLITRFSEHGREALRAHLSPADPATQIRLAGLVHKFQALGGSLAEAQQRAYAVLERTVRVQASVVAFEKVFLVMGVAFVCMLPLLLGFRRVRNGGGAGAH